MFKTGDQNLSCFCFCSTLIFTLKLYTQYYLKMPYKVLDSCFLRKNVRSWVFLDLSVNEGERDWINVQNIVTQILCKIYSFLNQFPFIAQCCHPCNCSSIHVFTFLEDEMNNLSWDELFISSERWIVYFNEMFEQIKIWCYCKIWDFFWLQIIWICNNCICFNV